MWNVQKTLALIEDLRQTPCLWDLQCKEYKSRTIKSETLEQLSLRYGLSVMDLDKKIQALKNQFRREHKKILEAERLSLPKQSQWFGYESMKFLLEQYESRRKVSTDDVTSYLNMDETTVEEMENVDCDRYSDEVLLDYPPIELVTDKKFDICSSRRPSKKMRKDSDTPEPQEAINCMKILSDIIPKRDEFTVYGEHIANKLRYSGRNRQEIIVAQHYIDDICFKLSMGEYSQNLHQFPNSSTFSSAEQRFSPVVSPSNSHYSPQDSPSATIHQNLPSSVSPNSSSVGNHLNPLDILKLDDSSKA